MERAGGTSSRRFSVWQRRGGHPGGRITPRQLYQLLVGEAGLSPEYFHTTLTYYEAQDYISGYNRRHRHVYEAARMIHGVVGGLFAKDYTLPEFPWDNEHAPKPHEYTEDEIEELRRQGEEWARELNKKA